jgi:hypothetical protein
MSDRYAGRIYVGGALPSRKLAALAKAIQTEDYDIEMNWSLGDDRRVSVALLRAWLKRRDHPRPLHLYASELIDGSFPALESWLCANGMSYLRHSHSYCDIEAEIVGFVDGRRLRYDANNAGDVMVHIDHVQRAYDALRQGRVFDAMDALSAIVPVVDEVPPFTVEYTGGRLR